MRIKDVQSGIRLDQNWAFMHRGEKGGWDSNFSLFADVINK